MLTITYCLFLSRAHDRNKGIKEKNTKVSKGKHAENYMNMHAHCHNSSNRCF